MRLATVSCEEGFSEPPPGMYKLIPPEPSTSFRKSSTTSAADSAGSTNTAPAPSPNNTQVARSVKSITEVIVSLPMTNTLRWLPAPTNCEPTVNAYTNPEHAPERSNP